MSPKVKELMEKLSFSKNIPIYMTGADQTKEGVITPWELDSQSVQFHKLGDFLTIKFGMDSFGRELTAFGLIKSPTTLENSRAIDRLSFTGSGANLGDVTAKLQVRESSSGFEVLGFSDVEAAGSVKIQPKATKQTLVKDESASEASPITVSRSKRIVI